MNEKNGGISYVAKNYFFQIINICHLVEILLSSSPEAY